MSSFFKVSLEAKMTFYDYHNYQLKGNDTRHTHAKFQAERSKTY